MALDAAIALIDEMLAASSGRALSSASPATDDRQSAPSSTAASGQTKKKAKQKLASDKTDKATAAEDPFQKACIQVGRVTAVEEFESDKLYCCQVAFADGSSKQIVAGLKKHIAIQDLLEHLVVVILNLKAAKLAGRLSEGMILAAVHAQGNGQELVHPLQPPGGSAAGDPVRAETIEHGVSQPKQLKSEVWRSIAAELKVVSGKATYRGLALHTQCGPVLVHSSMPEGSVIR